MSQDSPTPCKVRIIIPLHNEAETVESVALEVLQSVKNAGYDAGLLLVDDGSTDGSGQIIARLSAVHPEISFLSFSRNFGKEAALMAGFVEIGNRFDLLAYMDGDGQHSASDLVRLLKAAEGGGADIVCGVRHDRRYQNRIHRALSRMFYALFQFLSASSLDNRIGDFNVLTPKAAAALRSLREEHPFMKGLVSWIGFEKKLVPVTIEERGGGEASQSLLKLAKLAFGAIFSFSSWPLRIWSIVGAVISLVSIAYLIIVLGQTLIYGIEVPGYATTIITILAFGGIQLLSIGILGEYIARIYDTSKQRPRYIISERGGAMLSEKNGD